MIADTFRGITISADDRHVTTHDFAYCSFPCSNTMCNTMCVGAASVWPSSCYKSRQSPCFLPPAIWRAVTHPWTPDIDCVLWGSSIFCFIGGTTLIHRLASHHGKVGTIFSVSVRGHEGRIYSRVKRRSSETGKKAHTGHPPDFPT